MAKPQKTAKRTNPIVLRHGMSIGTGNAESDDEFLFDCFVEHPAVEEARRAGSAGMIISGRTGSGKTAILRSVQRSTENQVELDPAEMALDYVSNSDALRFVQAIGGDLNLLFQALWKHVLCIEFIRLRYHVQNEQKSRNIFAKLTEHFLYDERKKRSIEYLRGWEGKFWITMDQNIKEMTEAIEAKLHAEFGAEIEKFKAGGQYDKRMSTEKKSEFVARSRKIINSEQLSSLHGVIEILARETSTDQIFYILIDKLDENWVDTSVRFKMIRSLVEALRSFRQIRNLKILVALRTDVLERVVQETADASFQREKFEDYFINIRWNSADLKTMVDRRLVELFKRQYTGEAIGFDDVFPANMAGSKKTFEYMVERTLMRPRDVIAFVNECIRAADGRSEILVSDIRRAEVEFARKRRDALEQEWRSCFPTLRKVLDFLGAHRQSSISLRELADAGVDNLALGICAEPKIDLDPLFDTAKRYCDDGGADKQGFINEVAATLYRVGAAGIKVNSGDRLLYSHLDEPLISPAILTQESQLRLHPMLHAAFRLQEHGEVVS